MSAEITNLDLSTIKRRKITIDGDPDRFIELNISDMTITNRLAEAYPKLQKLQEDAIAEISKDTDDDADELTELANTINKIDKDMRKYIDYIFDYPVSQACAPSGSMYDPCNGKFRYEHILDALFTLYSNGITAEFDKLKNRVETKAQKYTKKRK